MTHENTYRDDISVAVVYVFLYMTLSEINIHMVDNSQFVLRKIANKQYICWPNVEPMFFHDVLKTCCLVKLFFRLVVCS